MENFIFSGTGNHLNKLRFKAHPWHGIHLGDNAPRIVNAYIEIVPTDTVKYELDK
jgi:inorganic pyrophosphatase